MFIPKWCSCLTGLTLQLYRGLLGTSIPLRRVDGAKLGGNSFSRTTVNNVVKIEGSSAATQVRGLRQQ